MKRFLILVLLGLWFSISYAQLPDVVLKDINGATVNVAELNNGGKPFIISFFATWCKPCNRELSAIAEVYDEWQEETGVKLIAISVDQAQNVNKVKPLVDNHAWPYETVLLDVNGDMKRALGVQSIPHVFIFDGSGKIVYNHIGYTDGSEEELIEKVKELL